MKNKKVFKTCHCGSTKARATGGSAKEPLISSQAERGFTLIELFIVMAIISILVLVTVPMVGAYKDMAKVARCEQDLNTIEKEISAYAIDQGHLPAGLANIHRDNFLDPWGHPYVYSIIDPTDPDTYYKRIDLTSINDDFDLFSKGKDGTSSEQMDVGQDDTDDDVIRADDGGYTGRGDGYL